MKLKLLFALTVMTVFSNPAFAQVSPNEGAAREWISAHSRELYIKPFHTFKLSFVKKAR